MSDMLKRNSAGPKYQNQRHYKNQELIDYWTFKFSEDYTKPVMLSCDTEDNSKGETKLINFFDGKMHYTFENVAPAMEWLIQVSRSFKKGVTVWFANLGYDIGNLFRDNVEHFSATLAGSRFITAKVYQERIKFKDVLNVMPHTSVKKLGKMIGLEKIETDSFENVEYCQVDTEIVFWAQVFFEKTLNEINVDLRNTAASTGFNALIKQYPVLTENYFKHEEHLFLQQGYCGGRTEVFNTASHSDNIWGYDITSCYPDAMRRIPIMDNIFRKRTKRPDIDKFEGMADCTVGVEKLEIPYLPVKYDNKLIFPVGTFRGVWTYFELREAQKLGYKIIKIHDAIEFTRKHDFNLEEFVLKFFKLKEEAKESNFILSYSAKIILNASYGKLAMGNEKMELATMEEFFKKKGNFSSVVYPNDQVAIKTIDAYAPTTNFLTASHITAYGRHNLYQYLIKATEKGRILLYCDTDSVFFKGPKFSDNKKKGELGGLDLQYEINECQFVLPKTYMIKTKDNKEIYKCKGVWGDLAKEYFTKGFVEKMQPLKYIETCRKNLYIQIRNKKNKGSEPMIPFNLWVKKIKAKNSDYNKRKVLKNGVTQALCLNYDVETNQNKN